MLDLPLIKCKVCHKEFKPKTRKATMCSNKCRNLHYSDTYKQAETKGFERARAIVKKWGGVGI